MSVNDTSTISTSETLDTETFLHSMQTLDDTKAIQSCRNLLTSGRIDDVEVARTILDAAELRSAAGVERIRLSVQGLVQADAGNGREDALRDVIGEDSERETLMRAAVEVDDLRKRIDTYELLVPSHVAISRPTTPATNSQIEVDDPWAEYSADDSQATPIIDDPWETSSNTSARSQTSAKSNHSARSVTSAKSKASVQSAPSKSSHRNEEEEPPLSLSAVLSHPITTSAIRLASSASIPALRLVFDRHPELSGYRFQILEAIPAWVSPVDLDAAGLLPRLGSDGVEVAWPVTQGDDDFLASLPPDYHLPISDSTDPGIPRRTAEELAQWYTSRITSLDELGQLDLQLAWVQHGASLGIPNLDALGEDLSLLSRLIYDSNLILTQHEKWSLNTWRQASEGEIVSAYLSNSKASTVVDDIRRLVLPYLYVLESRTERSGKPDTTLVDRLLHDAILTLPLEFALPVFSASTATTPTSERLIKNDLTVARLALASLYGSDSKDAWSTKSAIFECLPVWDVSGGDPNSDKEATSMTLDSIATFVRPRRAGDKPPTAKDLFFFFTPLPFASLSRALDILDVHLESGEILARWDTPVQLRFLLQSAREKGDQVELAEKMVRRQSARGPHPDGRWLALWGDMLKLNGGGESLLRGAFGVLSVEDLMKIYLAGVLSVGKFDLARRLVQRLDIEHSLPQAMLQDAVLTASREFYDNAENGNLHTGGMKLAYDCLALASLSDPIKREREFIEATSRLSTFNLTSPSSPRSTITPLEIRHTKNRLDLIRRLLSSSDDAFRHSEIIIELAEKLGLFRQEGSERVEILGMLIEACVKADEYETADVHCQSIVEIVKKKRSKVDVEVEGRKKDVCWKSCKLLGGQVEFADVGAKMRLLGIAIEYCPAGEIPGILEVWRKVEDGQIRLGEAAKRRRLAGIANPALKPVTLLPTSPTQIVEGEKRVLGSRTAARLAMNFGERLRQYAPSPVHSDSGAEGGFNAKRSSIESDRDGIVLPISAMFDEGGAEERERLRLQARRALVKGVGWLLGSDEKEIGG